MKIVRIFCFDPRTFGDRMDKNRPKQSLFLFIQLSLKELTKQSSGIHNGRKPVLNDFLNFITN